VLKQKILKETHTFTLLRPVSNNSVHYADALNIL